MTIRDFSSLKQESREALDRCGGQKRLALVYTGGLVGLSLLLTVLDSLLADRISGTGGLGNLGTRSLLSTLQTMLPILQMLVMLGWNAGYTISVLKILRREPVGDRTLLSGFSLFFPMLRAMLLEGLLFFNIAFLSFFVSMQIYLFTPWAEELMAVMEPMVPSILEGTAPVVMEDAMLLGAMDAMLPMVLLFGGLYLVLSVPVSYMLRFSTFCLVDAPRSGAIRAMAASRRMLRGNLFRLFRLDLRFWWYHGLLAIASLIQMLPLMGILLPQGFDITYYVCYGVYLAIIFAVYAFARNRVECTYAAAYDSLREKPKENAVVLGNIFDMR